MTAFMPALAHTACSPSAGRIAIVSGGTSGIGLATVLRLLETGHKVAFFGQNPVHVENACEEIAARFPQGRFLGRTTNILDQQALRSFFKETVSTLGQPEILVCCAAISPKSSEGKAVSLADTTLDEWHTVMDVNLTGTMRCCQLVLPFMQKAGFGRIIFVGSIAGRTIPRIASCAYATSKAALSGLARSLVSQYSSFGITINIIAPGRIATAMAGSLNSDQNLSALTRIPVGRLGTPEDIASSVCFLASAQSSFINGAILDVNGGEFTPP